MTNATSTASTVGNRTAATNSTGTNNQSSAAGNATATAPSDGGGANVSVTQRPAIKTTDAFDPNPAQAKAGDKVTWTDTHSTPHTVTSGKNSKPDGKFDSAR